MCLSMLVVHPFGKSAMAMEPARRREVAEVAAGALRYARGAQAVQLDLFHEWIQQPTSDFD